MADYLRVIFVQHLFWWGIMTSSLAVLLFFFVTTSLADATVKPRNHWGASLPAQQPTRISGPVTWVIIHHSGANNDCSGRNCSQVVKHIQQYHMEHQKWSDIGYNFLVAPTGDVFEGRGWGAVGAHAPKYNSKSVGICLIGDYHSKTPSEAQLSATQQLISRGVELNKVKPLYKLIGQRQVRATTRPGDKLFPSLVKHVVAGKTPSEAQLSATQQLISRGVELNKVKPLYKLIGHRQVRATTCPGEKLFEIIQTWPNYDKHSE